MLRNLQRSYGIFLILPNFSAVIYKKLLFCCAESALGLLLSGTELLYVDSVLHFEALENGRLVELLACAEFLNDAGLLILPLELLKSSFDVLALFNWYDNHTFCLLFKLLDIVHSASVETKAVAKLRIILLNGGIYMVAKPCF